MKFKPPTPLPAIPPLSSSDLLCCVGCGEMPINIGNMGRLKFVCRTYQARSRKTTPKCDGGQLRPMWHEWYLAADDWNSIQHNTKVSSGAKTT